MKRIDYLRLRTLFQKLYFITEAFRGMAGGDGWGLMDYSRF